MIFFSTNAVKLDNIKAGEMTNRCPSGVINLFICWKCLGVTITNDLKWNTHISNICTKANRTLGFLRRTLFSCPQNVKEAAYKGMVRPILEYGSLVWDPHPDKLKKELEKVQNRAARFVTRNYDYETGSMTGILGQLKWGNQDNSPTRQLTDTVFETIHRQILRQFTDTSRDNSPTLCSKLNEL